ncbi:MAG: hypothetical protein LBG52_06285, partial [Candidatus Peribacteria bacterium]|nr:hypothetical protein [Candidatus Peribacteria bacterium]
NYQINSKIITQHPYISKKSSYFRGSIFFYVKSLVIQNFLNFIVSVMMFIPIPGTVDIPLATIISIVLVWTALEMIVEFVVWGIRKVKKE